MGRNTMSIKDYPARLTTGYYRVRETWEDASSQLGAFRLLPTPWQKRTQIPAILYFPMKANPSTRSRSLVLRKQRSRPDTAA